MDKKTFEKTILGKSPGKTEKIGENFAGKILQLKSKRGIVLSLEGELGEGKTTFLKGFARGLGIKDRIKSPTFVIMRRHQIKRKTKNEKCKTTDKNSKFRNFYHFDCYRVERPKEILELGWQKIISNPENIVAVEWGNKIKNILPKKTIEVIFKTKKKNEREIRISI